MGNATLPPIPKTVMTPLGPVPGTIVVNVDAEFMKGQPPGELFGMWFPNERRIKLHKDLSLEVQWVTLFHEQMHAILWDTGLHNLFEEDQIEALCDAVGTARFLELKAKSA